jgi:hypothetical protein
VPLVAIVPSAADPPGAPLTAQLTEVLELPETLAVNWKVLPARMFAVVGEMVTEVEAGVPGLFPPPPELLVELPEPVAAHPMATMAGNTAANSAGMIGEHLSGHRMAVRTHLGPHASEISVSQIVAREYWTEGKKKGRDPTRK